MQAVCGLQIFEHPPVAEGVQSIDGWPLVLLQCCRPVAVDVASSLGVSAVVVTTRSLPLMMYWPLSQFCGNYGVTTDTQTLSPRTRLFIGTSRRRQRQVAVVVSPARRSTDGDGRLATTTGVDGRRTSCVVLSWVVDGVGRAVVADVDSHSRELAG